LLAYDIVHGEAISEWGEGAKRKQEAEAMTAATAVAMATAAVAAAAARAGWWRRAGRLRWWQPASWPADGSRRWRMFRWKKEIRTSGWRVVR
jgi:hypothetical protein